ncbi:tetratricopeptide repeat protein [Acinetobacter brisouii]|uniref:tetratricopeptide repeat protein n=1 Tax=Acinetobacter brisouii TaxID=396323 RepID=UPI00124F8ED1|nr:SEL1-like repeat protein [Acinetobacter brisouii]
MFKIHNLFDKFHLLVSDDQLPIQSTEAMDEFLEAQHYQDLLQQHPEQTLEYNYQRNALWNYLSAASRGYPEAQYQLALCYLHGQLGLKQDITKVKKWLELAANHGHLSAQQVLDHQFQQSYFS